MNKEVDHIYIKKNKWSTLQFEEIRPHRYLINDLDYSEIDWRIKWLHAELSAHEISSYAHIMKLSDDVEFLLSVDRDDMSYKGTLPFLSADSWIEPGTGKIKYGKVTLSAFVDQSKHIYQHCVKFGDMFKLSAVQWNENTVYDKNNVALYLGENDYFIINAPFLHVSALEWSNLDIFRNSESEYAGLCVELMHQINATSSYISGEVNRISSEISSTIDRLSTELSTELCACELSVKDIISSIEDISIGISAAVIKLSTELSTELCACELSVNGLSVEVDRLSTELSTELCACELSVDGLSVRTAEICAELSTTIKLSVDSLQ